MAALISSMILFLSPYKNVPDCVALIQQATREEVKTVDSVRLALSALHNHEFTAVVADENLLECSPGTADALLQRMQSAVPVFLDMACMGPERISRHVELAMYRRGLEYKSAREMAVAELNNSLKSELTALLISSEIALESPNLPAQAAEKLATILDSAKRIQQKLA